MTLASIHRVVTGHDVEGKAVVVFDGPLPTILPLESIPGTIFHEIWSTSATPAPIDNGADPTLGALVLSPPKSGTRIRFVDIPPDTPEFLAHGADRMKAAFTQIGEEKASTVKSTSPHPLMHRTESVDYGIVIEGEITMILDDSEVILKPGSVVIQRGTNHAWANRSQKTIRMLFILVDGRYDPAIASALAGR